VSTSYKLYCQSCNEVSEDWFNRSAGGVNGYGWVAEWVAKKHRDCNGPIHVITEHNESLFWRNEKHGTKQN